MNPLDIISRLPQWAGMSPADILASPAWSMPCRFGEAPAALRIAQVRPSDTLDLAVSFDGERAVIALADSAAFADLHALWASRADVPEPILLALVEKECAPLLQLIENAVRRQLKIEGLAERPEEGDSLAFILQPGGISFALSATPGIVTALGQRRYLDVAQESVSSVSVAAEVEYAAFAMPPADASSIEPGDALLLPEIGSLEPRSIIEGRLVATTQGVGEWKDDGRLRICAEPSSITVGELVAASPKPPPAPRAEQPLRLVRFGKTVASGRFGRVGSQAALIVESV